MLRTFKYLLPISNIWSLTVDRPLRRLFESLTGPVLDDVKAFYDDIYDNLSPFETDELKQWESAFGLVTTTTLSESDRRERLASLWAANGGQSPRYIQDVLQSAGFNAYVHEWWVPGTNPPVARDPFDVLGSVQYGAGDPEMECGEPLAECGNFTPVIADSHVLVNKLYSAALNYTCECGEPLAECGEPLAECGNNTGIIFTRQQYAPPTNPADWPYVTYIGDQTFGDPMYIDENRRDELEDLLLKVCPQHLWIVLIVDYASPIVEDTTELTVVEDGSEITLVEA